MIETLRLTPPPSLFPPPHHISHWLNTEEDNWVRKLKSKGHVFKNDGPSAMQAEDQKSIENNIIFKKWSESISKNILKTWLRLKSHVSQVRKSIHCHTLYEKE